MKVYAKLFRPPVTPYWSLSVACGGEFIVAQLHWDGDTCEKEFESMASFLEFAKEEGLTLPWKEDK